MLNHKVGDVVLVQGVDDLQDSQFAIVVSKELWDNLAPKSAQESYNNLSQTIKQIPFWVLEEDLELRLAFAQESELTRMGNLYDAEFSHLLTIFWCFSLRDGMRYYGVFRNILVFYKRFLDGETETSRHSLGRAGNAFIEMLLNHKPILSEN